MESERHRCDSEYTNLEVVAMGHSPSLGLRITVFIVNQIARVFEGAIMRFPLETDLDDLHESRTGDPAAVRARY